MPLSIAQNDPLAQASHASGVGFYANPDVPGSGLSSLPPKLLSQEERVAKSLRDHVSRFTTVPEGLRLPHICGDEVELPIQETGTTQAFVHSVCMPMRGQHNQSKMPECRWLNSVVTMRLRAQNYVQQQIDALPKPYFSTLRWLPGAVRNHFDNRAALIAQQLPGKFMHFANGAMVLSIVDTETYRSLMRFVSTSNKADPILNDLTHTTALWLKNEGQHQLTFNPQSFDGLAIRTQTAKSCVGQLKGEALSKALLPNMEWTQPLHKLLVFSLEAVVTRELRGYGELPNVARHLLNTVGIDACMKAYLTSEPEVLRPFYTALAFQEANHNVRQAIQKLISADQGSEYESNSSDIVDMMDHLGRLTICTQHEFEEMGQALNIKETQTGAMIDWKSDEGLRVFLNQDSREAYSGQVFTLEAAAKIYQNPMAVDRLNDAITPLKPSLIYLDVNKAVNILHHGLAAHLMREAVPEAQNMLQPNVILMADMVKAVMDEQGAWVVLDAMIRTRPAAQLNKTQLSERLSLLLMMLDEQVPAFSDRAAKLNQMQQQRQAA